MAWNKNSNVRGATDRPPKPPQQLPDPPVTLHVLVRAHVHCILLTVQCVLINLRNNVVLFNKNRCKANMSQ